jgi:hypothetical protein
MIISVSIKMIKWVGQVAYVAEKRNAYEVLVGRPRHS